MQESITYDKNRKVLVRRISWEETHEDGTIEHHFSESVDTNRSKKYVRVFTEHFCAALRALDKNAADALVYIISIASRSTNIASVNYSKLEKYLEISNQSVSRIMTLLQDKDHIRMVERGQWMYNPDLGAGCYSEQIPTLIAFYNSLPKRKAKGGKSNNVDSSNNEQSISE